MDMQNSHHNTRSHTTNRTGFPIRHRNGQHKNIQKTEVKK